jgi:glycosyltransferase involved in cell wall biosynthesis
MSSKAKVTAIIPALNEEACVGHVIQGIPRDVVQEVIVVDNGSVDATARVAEAAGARVVHERRRGYGYACHAGAEAASTHPEGDILVFLDGDGSFDPRECVVLVQPILAGSADLVLGSRETGRREAGAVLAHQRLGNLLAARLLGWFGNLRVTDLGPFRAVRSDVLKALGMREMTYGWPIEMMVKAARNGYRITEVPVSSYPRVAGRSKVSGTVRGTVLAAYRILVVTMRYSLSLHRCL